MNIKLKTLQECLNHIQINLVSPKDKRTDFGSHYKYRHIEDIFMALKPLLKDTGCVVTASDSVEQVGDRYYIQSTVTISKGDESVSSVGIARETESKKGMDDAQLSGACSSYSRKYAICGLLAIDSNDDIDAMDNATAHDYKTHQDETDYAERLKHKAFDGKKEEVKDRWDNAKSLTEIHQCLNKMRLTIIEYNKDHRVKSLKPKPTKGDALTVKDDGTMGFNGVVENTEVLTQ